MRPPRALEGFRPGGTIDGEVRVPASKSLAQRALLCAALAEGRTRMARVPESDDARHLEAALEAAGARIQRGQLAGTRVVAGAPPGPHRGLAARSPLDVGESGTAARLLTTVLALAGRVGETATIAAQGTLLARSSPALFAALERAGVRLAHEGRASGWPVTVATIGPPSVLPLEDPDSSQEVSALLLAAAAWPDPIEVRVRGAIPSRPYVDMTLGVLASFGVRAEALTAPCGEEAWLVHGSLVAPERSFVVEPDASAAAVALVAGCLAGGEARVFGLRPDSLQGDVAIVDHLEALGCEAGFEDGACFARGDSSDPRRARLRALSGPRTSARGRARRGLARGAAPGAPDRPRDPARQGVLAHRGPRGGPRYGRLLGAGDGQHAGGRATGAPRARAFRARPARRPPDGLRLRAARPRGRGRARPGAGVRRQVLAGLLAGSRARRGAAVRAGAGLIWRAAGLPLVPMSPDPNALPAGPVLVAGGAGYIGSHTVRLLEERGVPAVVFDNLSTGHRAAVGASPLVVADLGDREALAHVFREHEPRAVIHFAAKAFVGESVEHPSKYYRENVVYTWNLLEEMRAAGVNEIVFSSTCATYGEPVEVPITEDHPQLPISPYGRTKLHMEHMMQDYAAAYGLNYAALRYFNAAGAARDGSLGEDHDPETHLIPLVLQVALGQRASIKMFGDDWETPDGTCVRDYIHVEDLADAHLRALARMQTGGGPLACNLGTGDGFSVKQVIDVARGVTGHAIPAEVAPRRAGDPAVLMSGGTRAADVLGWRPARSALEDILADAWAFHSAHPTGYES